MFIHGRFIQLVQFFLNVIISKITNILTSKQEKFCYLFILGRYENVKTAQDVI